MQRALISLLLLAIVAFSFRISRAQQPTPSPHPSDRPIRVVKVSAPFSQYRYRLATGTEGRYFAGFSKMVLNLSGANEPPAKPGAEELGRGKYEAITLERGVTHDPDFSQWAGLTQEHQQSRELVLDVFNEIGQKTAAHKLTGCTVVEYNSLPNLDGGANAISIEHLKLRCNGVK